MASTAEQAFQAAIAAAGLTPPDEIIADGKIHRFATNDELGDEAGWYVLRSDGMEDGAFGCWREGLTRHWCSKSTNEMTLAECEIRQNSVEAMKAQRDSDQAQRNASAAVTAARRFEAATPCTSHQYLTTKGVQAYGLLQEGDNLLVPLHESTGALHSLQTITPVGEKRFLFGGRVQGCFHAIGKPRGVLIVCEGYATGASIHEATGHAVAVAFNAGNLEAVALALRPEYPDLQIVLAADDDYQTEGNPGMTKALAAAVGVGGYLAVPDFGANRPETATDFNDLHRFAGLAAVKRGIDSAINTVAATARKAVSKVQLDDVSADTHRNAPRPDRECLYGLVADIAHAGSDNTEANPYAVAAAMLAYLGAALGRGPYMPIGDDCNHARLFLIHVGRSGLGRKGTAKKLIYRIDNAVKALDELLVPHVHRGGLSTREGLALMIHDGYMDGKNEVPAIEDKRLLVVESEFANILQQSKRDGNTLSAALRDAWDGTSIQPAVKTCRVWASDPHIGIIGDITPFELRDLMRVRELTNGFANRFIFFWSEGDKVLPFPESTPNDVVEALAKRVAKVLEFAGADRHADKDVMRMDFSPEAASLYASLYRGELRDRSAGDHITGLLDRRAPILLRLAMIFALTDQSTVIALAHINAAMAWVRYWVDSVKFIFQSALDEAGAADVTETARKILDYLTMRVQCTRTELSKICCQGHVSKDNLDKALDELLTASPPAIEVTTVPRAKGRGTPSKYYKVCLPSNNGFIASTPAKAADPANPADPADPAECEVSWGLPAGTAVVRSQRNVDVAAVEELPEFAQVATFADTDTNAPTRMDIGILQNSQNSQNSQSLQSSQHPQWNATKDVEVSRIPALHAPDIVEQLHRAGFRPSLSSSKEAVSRQLTEEPQVLTRNSKTKLIDWHG